jgi:alkylation response protein AidB-like acyl-CoA dehydrogenase
VPHALERWHATNQEWALNQEQPIDAFERELAAWLDMPDAPAASDARAWTRRLGEAGLLAPGWAPEHGGRGLDRERGGRHEAALRERGIRRGVSGGLTMLGPVLLEYASRDQQERFLPPIARGEATWAQGYSEPQAGSDLANVQMRCEDRGDHYLVNGQKIWTSGADESDWIFCLVRSDVDASKHDGISFLLVDLGSAGVTISPIVLISGRSPFCEVFFLDVKVPKGNLIGGAGNGWPIAKRLLQFERSMLGSGGLSSLTGSAGRKSLAEIARDAIGKGEDGALRDDALRLRVARQWVAERANRLTGGRARGADATRVSSILKLASSEASQQRYSLLMDLLGTDGLAWGGDGTEAEASIAKQWLRSRANTIEGGTSEVQLNIIAKRVLGMSSMQAGIPDQSLARGEDQSLIREGALQFLEEQQPIAELRALRDGDDPSGVSPRLWDEMAGLGWSGLLAPEDVGGAGLGFQELGVIFEALGRHVAPTPLFSSGVLATSALSLVDGWRDFPKAADLAAGSTRVALALEEAPHFEPRAIETVARRVHQGFELSGRKRPVLDGMSADLLLVVARIEGEGDRLGLFRVSPEAAGVTRTPLRWLDGRRAADLGLDGVQLDAAARIGKPVAPDALIEPLVDRASAALAAELAGTAAEALARSVEFLKTREQFDQKLAGFQALQHRCARGFSEVERTISVVQAALRAIDEGDAEASLLASAAKALASETARFVTEEALQLHGGLGMTEEQDIGLYFKRARASSVLCGDANEHYRRIARLSGF